MEAFGQHLRHRDEAHALHLRLLAIVGGDRGDERAGHVHGRYLVGGERVAARRLELRLHIFDIVGAQRLAGQFAIGRDRLVDVVADAAVDDARGGPYPVEQHLNLGNLVRCTGTANLRLLRHVGERSLLRRLSDGCAGLRIGNGDDGR